QNLMGRSSRPQAAMTSCTIDRRGMAGDAQLVPIRIAKVRTVVVVVVLGPQAGRTLAGADVPQGSFVSRSDDCSGGRGEGNHLPVSGMVRLSVMGLADDEEGPCPAGTVPASPGSFSLAEAQLEAETVHHWTVEAQGALEIA